MNITTQIKRIAGKKDRMMRDLCTDKEIAALSQTEEAAQLPPADGDEAAVEEIYATIAPAIVFAMQSIPHLLCYGKRLTAARLGMDPADLHDRAPALRPSDFGLECVRRYAEALGPL